MNVWQELVTTVRGGFRINQSNLIIYPFSDLLTTTAVQMSLSWAHSNNYISFNQTIKNITFFEPSAILYSINIAQN
jgi:hypothetical protein